MTIVIILSLNRSNQLRRKENKSSLPFRSKEINTYRQTRSTENGDTNHRRTATERKLMTMEKKNVISVGWKII